MEGNLLHKCMKTSGKNPRRPPVWQYVENIAHTFSFLSIEAITFEYTLCFTPLFCLMSLVYLH